MENKNIEISTFIWSTGNITVVPLNLKEKLADLVTIVKVLIRTHPVMNN